MTTKRIIEIFSAGCPVCNEAITDIQSLSCPSCHVKVLDMHDSKVAQRAKKLGIHSVPAVAINGKLADCCAGRSINMDILRAAGLGKPIL